MSMITGEHRQQLEFLEDRERWRSGSGKKLAKLAAPPSFASEHEQLLSMAAVELPPGRPTEAQNRDYLHLRWEAEAVEQRLLDRAGDEPERRYAAAVSGLLTDRRKENARLEARMAAETDKALSKLRGLRAPDDLAERHAALIAAYERFQAELAAFWGAYAGEDFEEALTAWRRVEASSQAVVEATERLNAALGA